VARGVAYSVVHVAEVESSTVAAAVRRDRINNTAVGTGTGTSTTIDVVVVQRYSSRSIGKGGGYGRCGDIVVR